MSRKKVLMIAHYFPPSGGSGVQRPAKFVKYLRLFGWEPVVLTVDLTLEVTDQTLLADIPDDVRVIRTATLQPPYAWKHQKGPLNFLYRLINLVSVPDIAIWWLPFALWTGAKLLREEKIEAIYATGQPFSDFLIGVILKKIYRTPLVLDFRDPWMLHPYRWPRSWHVFWREPIERWFEAWCVKTADKIICVSPHAVLLFESRYSQEMMKKFAVITNGFDPADLEVTEQPKPDLDAAGKITLLYMGKTVTHNAITPHVFLEGVQLLLSREPHLKEKLRCLFVGQNLRVDLPGLEAVVQWRGYVDHNRAIELLQQADVLLLLAGWSLHRLPGKTFEYIATGKPILALAPAEGATAEILHKTNVGKIVSPTDPEDVAVGLGQMLDAIQAGVRPSPNWSAISAFDRKNTTKQLAVILNEMSAPVALNSEKGPCCQTLSSSAP